MKRITILQIAFTDKAIEIVEEHDTSQVGFIEHKFLLKTERK